MDVTFSPGRPRLLDAATTRGATKRLDADPELRRAMLDEGNARGANLPTTRSTGAPTGCSRARAREASAPARQGRDGQR